MDGGPSNHPIDRPLSALATGAQVANNETDHVDAEWPL
jgi:hypothetical protein